MYSTRAERPWMIAALCALALAGGGCRKRAATRALPPAASDASTCPSPEALAQVVHEEGRVAKTDCVSYAPGFFWLAAALSYQPDSAANPRLAMIYGGQPMRAFDLEPVPQDVLTRLIKGNPDLRVSIRKPAKESHLVRVGVFGQHGADQKLEADELVAVLKLVAHAPPHLLWTGPGDQVRTTPEGCVAERTVDFDMPFGDRLEMTTMARSHRQDPKGKQTCPAGQSTQQTVEYRGVALKAARTLVPAK